jgi:hypothetical protein
LPQVKHVVESGSKVWRENVSEAWWGLAIAAYSSFHVGKTLDEVEEECIMIVSTGILLEQMW